MIGLNVKPVEEPKHASTEKDPNFPKVFDDGAFTVDKGDHGYQSFGKDGKKLIYSGSEFECVFWSRAWLKAQQEGWPEHQRRVVHSGIVGGKL